MFPFRLDRSGTLSIFGPISQRIASGSGGIMPILMYHSVSGDPEEGLRPYYRVATSPERFAEQMKWLSELGCAGVTLEEGLSRFAKGLVSGCRPVAITFDDGFRDFHSVAWPILRKHGFTATMYLPTGFISSSRKLFRGKECLTWEEVRELRRYGVRFGSHTVNHEKLYEMPWSEIEREATVSKDRLQQEMQEEVTSFAYPYAFPQEDSAFVKKLKALLCEAGYSHCATTLIGCAKPSDNRFYLKRLPANSCDDKALFVAKLQGAYDWLGFVQRGFRLLKRKKARTELT